MKYKLKLTIINKFIKRTITKKSLRFIAEYMQSLQEGREQINDETITYQ